MKKLIGEIVFGIRYFGDSLKEVGILILGLCLVAAFYGAILILLLFIKNDEKTTA